MKAVIFAAGVGKRMQPLTFEKPKPLLEVLGKPLLRYTFESLPDDVEEVILIVGYKQEQIRSYIGDTFLGKKVTYIVQEKITGTMGALLLAKSLLMGQKFLTLCADDIYSKADLEKLRDVGVGMLLSTVDDPSRFGVVLLDAHGRVVDIEEKPTQPKSNLIATGVYLLDDRIFTYSAPIHENGEQYLPDCVGQFAKDIPLRGIQADQWIQIGFPEDLERAEQMLRNR